MLFNSNFPHQFCLLMKTFQHTIFSKFFFLLVLLYSFNRNRNKRRRRSRQNIIMEWKAWENQLLKFPWKMVWTLSYYLWRNFRVLKFIKYMWKTYVRVKKRKLFRMKFIILRFMLLCQSWLGLIALLIYWIDDLCLKHGGRRILRINSPLLIKNSLILLSFQPLSKPSGHTAVCLEDLRKHFKFAAKIQ